MSSPTSPPISLLWASPEDSMAIAALHAKLFPTAWDSDAIQALIEHPASLALIAARPGREIVGFIIAQIAADEAEILTVGVAPESQRHGVGRQLVDGVARAAARSDARRLFLDVAAGNAPAGNARPTTRSPEGPATTPSSSPAISSRHEIFAHLGRSQPG